jgi:hypothetical protein
MIENIAKFLHNTWRNILEYNHFRTHHRKDLKSHHVKDLFCVITYFAAPTYVLIRCSCIRHRPDFHWLQINCISVAHKPDEQHSYWTVFLIANFINCRHTYSTSKNVVDLNDMCFMLRANILVANYLIFLNNWC